MPQTPQRLDAKGVSELKVCFATWAPFYAGAEVAALRLAAGLQEAGADVVVVVGTQGVTFGHLQSHGLRGQYVPLAFTDKGKFWRYFRAQICLRRLFRSEGPHIIHANDLTTGQMIGQAAQRLGIPRVCHHRWAFEKPGLEWLNKFGAERHLFVSRALMESLIAQSNTLKEAPCKVVYDGLPLPARPTAEERRRAREKLGLPTGKTVVTLAGQVIERKGVADLIRAWSLLPAATRGDAHLLVIGDDLAGKGAYRRLMEGLATSLGVEAQFVGFQPDVSEWLTASEIAVVPSHEEPLGNATLEAMSFALPVIGSRVGGIPEMIVDRSTGQLVPPRSPHALAQALEAFLAAPHLRRQYGQAGRRRCEEKFSLDTHVQNVLRQYEAVLAEHRP
jgi:glycosyltransferase involved in cell wall biosynthesis